MTENVTEQHRVLKSAVIIMGVLIVISVAVIIVTIAIRASQPADEDASQAVQAVSPPAPPAAGHPVSFGDLRVVIPAGAEVLQMSVSGDRLLLLLSDEAGDRRIHVADATSGAHLGSYHLTPEDPAKP